MRRLDRHISRSVVLAMLVVIALIASLDLIFSLIDELGDAEGDYTVASALAFVALTTPTSVYELLPFTALGGALIGLGVLASNNELVVMQSAGVRNSRIVFAVLKPTAVIMLLSLLIGEYVAPPLEQLANSNKAVQLSGNASINAEQGVWRKIGEDYIHINAIAPGGASLFGVTRYRVDGQRRLSSASFAESAEYQPASDRPYWLLNNVQTTVFTQAGLRTQNYLQEEWQVELSPELLSVLLVEPDRQSISGLYRFARFFESEGLDSSTYFLAFWKKLFQPVTTLALVILAISFIFGPLRESTMGFRVFVALAIGLVFTILQRMMEPASLIYGFSPLLAVLVPILIAVAAGSYLLRRTQ